MSQPISWKLIDELPEACKDGRRVLLWDGYDADVGRWSETRWWNEGPGWNDTSGGGPLNDITHFSEINAPE